MDMKDRKIIQQILNNIQLYFALNRRSPMLYMSSYLYNLIYDEYQDEVNGQSFIFKMPVVVETDRNKYSHGFESIYYVNADLSNPKKFFEYDN
jgi:hypothetical protein